MIKYEGKECKSFVNKIVKLINGVNKYNVESILLIQIFKSENSFEPVIESKPMDVDVFEYLKTIYSDNEIINRSLTYMDMDKIKKKIDKLYYSPVIFASMTPIPFMKLTPEDLENKDLILPSKYSNNTEYSKSYFIVTDLFKNFIKEHDITAVDENLKFYDNDGLVYDTYAFIYLNEINKNFETKMVEETSPKQFLPIFIGEEDDAFINKHVKELLVKLNIAAINRQMNDIMIIDKNVGVIDDEETLDEVDKRITEGQPFILKDKNEFNEILTFPEFFKINPKEILFTSKECTTIIDGQKSLVNYAGIALKTKDFIIYLFYKFFNYNNN
jgi:hypothetical protein